MPKQQNIHYPSDPGHMFLLIIHLEISDIFAVFYVDPGMLDSTTDVIHIFVNILTGWKSKSHCYISGI